MKAILKKNPELDFLYGYIGGTEIPTKQDKFKPLEEKDLFELIDGKLVKIDSKDLYQKKELKPTHKDFETELRENLIKEVKGNSKFPIKSPQKVEVILSIQMTEKRLKSVDVDNLTKSILDCMSGIIFDDDSQVVNVLASKDIHPLAPINGLMFGVRKTKDDSSDSWFKDVNLAHFEYEEEVKQTTE